MLVKDAPGVLEEVSAQFKLADVSIKQFLQKESTKGEAQIVLITDIVKESKFNDIKSALLRLDVVTTIDSTIRVGL